MLKNNRVLIAAIAIMWPSVAFSMGYDIKGPVRRGTWASGLEDLANRADRVHGYNINMTDVFFYSGNLTALNEFLSKYALLKVNTLEVVLHPGSTKARSPWHKPGKEVPANWSLRVESPWSTQRMAGVTEDAKVDVWLGALGPLTELDVPLNVPVRSGGEIERFIAEHESRRKR